MTTMAALESRSIGVKPALARTEVAGLVALAARTVPMLWPLESAIAVNPLAGFEDLPFDEAVRLGAARFGARETLPLAAWRALVAAGRIDRDALHEEAIAHFGGLECAFSPIGPDVSRLDLLMARLLDLPAPQIEAAEASLSPAAAFVAKWCGAFFDQGQAAAPMPGRDKGLYRAVLALAPYDTQFRTLGRSRGRDLLRTVPSDPLEAISDGLAALSVPPGAEVERLSALVARLPGWAGHIRWRSEHADADVAAGADAEMADLLALWLLVERACPPAEAAAPPGSDAAVALARHFGFGADLRAQLGEQGHAAFLEIAGMREGALGALFLRGAERSYREALVPQLRAAAAALPPADLPDAQLVFCIDVRSEPFRRALERQGRYETLGYAGFFGLPIALHRAGEERRERLLPVLLAPQHDVAEAPVRGREALADAFVRSKARAGRAAAVFDTLKQGAATAFATAEAMGPPAGVLMAARTLAPRLVDRIAGAFSPVREEAFAPSVDADAELGKGPFTLDEKIGYALALFRLTGLPEETARLVVLVGHRGHAVNNPYAAALDCGACGGHGGAANARVLTAMLNDAEVRAGLAARGVKVPATTAFVAAEHCTTTDRVTIFDRCRVPASHHAELDALAADLARAGAENRARRAALLDRTPDDLLTGALHWGEVRPEWGLAGNAAFIVGPRALTRDIDLGGRAFLHSYNWEGDADGAALTTILTAPMVVAQWINCQYLFSTLDNARYGSGDKVTQNVLGGVGVVQGNGGDLKVGLPRQSLFTDDGAPFHLPQRLMTVVLAPLARVRAVIEANDILVRLFGNGWVSLVVIDPETGCCLRWRSDDEASASFHQEPELSE